MVKVSETARIVTTQPSDDASDIVRASWLVWRSVAGECERKGIVPQNGVYRYVGAMRGHVINLWPTMPKDERTELEKQIYAYLRSTKLAVCVKRQNPPTWHVAVEYETTIKNAAVVPMMTYRMRETPTERKLTPEEAGEHMPPAPVTVTTTTTKETTQVTSTIDRAAPLRDANRKRLEERDARQALVIEVVKSTTEPLVADEVAYSLGIDVATARKDLTQLAAEGSIFSRKETKAERALRFDGVARATRASLYSAKNPVPKRTKRVAVSGYSASPASFTITPPNQVKALVGGALSTLSAGTRFTASDIARKAGVAEETARKRIRELKEKGLVTSAGMKGNAHAWRMKDKDATLEYLGATTLPSSSGPHVSATASKPVPKPAPGVDLLTRAGEVLDENERLREQNARLQARITELEAELTARPSIDPGVAERLAAWTPSE